MRTLQAMVAFLGRNPFDGRPETQAIFAARSLILAVSMLALAVSVSVLSVLLFAMGGTMSPLVIPGALLFTGAFSAFLVGRSPECGDVRTTYKWLLIALVVLAAITVVSGLILDGTWDGQIYHLPAVIHLANGWNPIFDPPAVDRWADPFAQERITYYPKLTWTYAAALAVFTGWLEMGKSINFLFMASGGLLLASALCRSEKPVSYFRLGAAAACLLNPVVVKQLLSHYVDGALFSLIIGLVSLLLILRKGGGTAAAAAGLVLALVALVNIKFTGAVYAALICAFWFFWLALRRRLRPRVLALAVLGFAMGAGAVGYHPYVQNILTHGEPFYPYSDVAKSGSYDVAVNQRPTGLRDSNRLTKLFYGVFGKSTFRRNDPATLKFPLWFAPSEAKAIGAVGTRVGGFGPFFGLTILLLGVYGVFLVKQRRELDADFLILGLAFFLSAAVFPEPWHARLIPQLWAVPVFLVLAHGSPPLNGWPGRLGAGVIALLILNAGLSWAANSAFVVIRNYRLHDGYRHIATMNEPVEIFSLYPDVFRHRLEQRGISYRMGYAVCPGAFIFTAQKARACPKP